MNRLWSEVFELNITAIEHLQTPNPYQTVLDDLRQRLSLPATSTLLKALGISTGLLFVALAMQSLFVIYVMIVTKRFRFFATTSLGMWRFETINTHAFCAFGFSIFSIISWLLRSSCIRNGTFSSPAFRSEDFVNAARGICILFGSWCFIWASVCHCVSVVWMPQVMSRMPLKNSQGAQLPRNQRWLSHFVFLTPITLFSTFITWSIVRTSLVAKSFSDILSRIQGRLSIAAANYDDQNYVPATLREILAPSQAIPENHKKLNQYQKVALSTYLVFEVSMAVIYAPLLYVCLQDLRRRTAAVTLIDGTTSNQDEELSQITKRLQIAQRTLLYRAFSVYLFVLLGVPSMAWALRQDALLAWGSSESARRLGIAIDISYTFALNMNLMILTIHCSQLLRAHKRKKPSLEEVERVELFYLKEFTQT